MKRDYLKLWFIALISVFSFRVAESEVISFIIEHDYQPHAITYKINEYSVPFSLLRITNPADGAELYGLKPEVPENVRLDFRVRSGSPDNDATMGFEDNPEAMQIIERINAYINGNYRKSFHKYGAGKLNYGLKRAGWLLQDINPHKKWISTPWSIVEELYSGEKNHVTGCLWVLGDRRKEIIISSVFYLDRGVYVAIMNDGLGFLNDVSFTQMILDSQQIGLTWHKLSCRHIGRTNAYYLPALLAGFSGIAVIIVLKYCFFSGSGKPSPAGDSNKSVRKRQRQRRGVMQVQLPDNWPCNAQQIVLSFPFPDSFNIEELNVKQEKTTDPEATTQTQSTDTDPQKTAKDIAIDIRWALNKAFRTENASQGLKDQLEMHGAEVIKQAIQENSSLLRKVQKMEPNSFKGELKPLKALL
ncbi:MAG: hypothetical protein ACR2PX_00665 [Endozoicomonas sp.]|uniref:hypothetical protein n=1 Tax=Endozoicomonas sp. TaxID=1892382 RepID=UPI003D9B39F7